jgi:hypothetical protein
MNAPASLFALALTIVPTWAHAQVVIQEEPPVYGQAQGYVAEPSPFVATAPVAIAPPARTIVHSEPNATLVWTGALAFAGGFLVSAIGAYSITQSCSGMECPGPDTNSWRNYSLIPLAGPWIAYATTPHLAGYDGFNIFTGLVQDAGLVTFVLGFIIRDEWEEVVSAELGAGRRISWSLSPSALSANLTF